MSTAGGDLVICAFGVRRQAYLDLLGDRLDAFDPPSGALRGCFLGVIRHKAGKGDDTSIRGHTDMGGIDAGLEFELIENILAKL
jgi:hypothetical protein